MTAMTMVPLADEGWFKSSFSTGGGNWPTCATLWVPNIASALVRRRAFLLGW